MVLEVGVPSFCGDTCHADACTVSLRQSPFLDVEHSLTNPEYEFAIEDRVVHTGGSYAPTLQKTNYGLHRSGVILPIRRFEISFVRMIPCEMLVNTATRGCCASVRCLRYDRSLRYCITMCLVCVLAASRQDSRVPYWHAAKYVASIIDNRTAENPLLLQIREGAHIGGSHRSFAVDQSAFVFSFLMMALEQPLK